MQALLAGRNLTEVTGILPPAGSSQEQNDDNDDCAYLGQTLKRGAL